MFSFYGRKSKVIKYYPDPIYDTIIEPFAGSAVYSLYKDNWEKNIILVDKYELIAKLWRYLISSNKDEMISLPDVELRQDIRKLEIQQELKWLIGFYINQGSSRPKNIVQKWGARDWNRNRKYLADNIEKVSNWNIVHGDYKCLANIEATWFIDPPYQFGGEHYIENSIDYNELREWILTRKGQVIACENTKATWMDFKPLKELHGQVHRTTEAIWTNR